MTGMQRSPSRNAAVASNAVRLFLAAALLALAAAGCGDDAMATEDAGPRTDGGETDSGMDGSDAGNGSGGPTREALVNHALWQVVEASEDPFEDRPAQVSCPDGSFGSERFGGRPTFYVDSELCEYMTASQPSRAPISAGDEVDVEFKHFELTAPGEDGAEAHLAFMLGDTLIAERTVPIPAADKAYRVTWTAPEDVEEGTPIYFHAHNHGQNEYSVLSIEVVSGS